MKPLFFAHSFFCPRDCDRKLSTPESVRNVIEHIDGSRWSATWTLRGQWPTTAEHRGWYMPEGTGQFEEDLKRLITEGALAEMAGPGIRAAEQHYVHPGRYSGYVFRRIP